MWVDNGENSSAFSRSTIFRNTEFSVHAIRWPAFADVVGEGLEATPNNVSREPIPNVIVIPDADQTPEQLLGLMPGVPPDSQVARRLVETGCRVFVPALIDRTAIARNGRAILTNREYVYRPAFELGRHPIGYEVQKVIALVNWLTTQMKTKGRVGVFGFGEGGAIALFTACSTRGSMLLLSAAISTIAMTSGGSPSIATSLACWNNSETPKSQA